MRSTTFKLSRLDVIERKLRKDSNWRKKKKLFPFFLFHFSAADGAEITIHF